MEKNLIWISFAIVCLVGCDMFSVNEEGESPFVGDWVSTRQYEFTVGDSLYRDSLAKYMRIRGLDIDSVFMAGADYTYDTAVFHRSLREFDWNCPAGFPCGDRIWLESSKKRSTADSVFRITYRNGAVSDSVAFPYTYTEDSILYPITPTFHLGERYELKAGGDTLVLYGIFETTLELNDTLVRMK